MIKIHIFYGTFSLNKEGIVMNTHKMTRTVMVGLVLIMASGLLFAQGAKEAQKDAVIGRIVTVLESGTQPAFTVRTEDGGTATVVADENTITNFPVSALAAGDYVEIVVDSTLYAQNIRLVSPLVAQGYLNCNISMSSVMKPESLVNRFSYTYGYLLTKSLSSQGLFFDISYFVRGALDAIQVGADKKITEFYSKEEMSSIIQNYQESVWNAGKAPTAFSGTETNDLETIGELGKDDDTIKSFSYTYGYLITANMISQGMEVNGSYFAYGMLDMGCESTPIMTDEEMQTAFTEYQKKVEDEYNQWKEKTQVENLRAAEGFLENNKKKEGVVTTGSGLQYQILVDSDGQMPVATDTVSFNYILKDIEGTVIQDSKKSSDSPAKMAVNNLVQGLIEGIPLMKVGSTYRFWIHPSLGYGEEGSGNIEPNSLLVFDIELLGIESATDQTPATTQGLK